MRTYLRKVPPALIVIAFVLLLGIVMISVGHLAANGSLFLAGLMMVAGGAITGALRLTLRHRWVTS